MAELLDFTKPHVLRNEAEYTAAVMEIDQLLDLDPPPHSEAYERLEFLSVLVHAYEEAHFPLEQLTTPQDIVAFTLEQKGLLQTDLAQWLGGESPMLSNSRFSHKGLMHPYHQLSLTAFRLPLPGFRDVFGGTESLRVWLKHHDPSCSRRNFPPTTRCRLTRLSCISWDNEWRLGGINRKARGGLLQPVIERFEELSHGLQGIIIEQGSHPLPQPTLAPQFGPHRLAQRAAQLLDLIH
jgi:antitoxin component HigA of HigAB toxin-antitoxin module